MNLDQDSSTVLAVWQDSFGNPGHRCSVKKGDTLKVRLNGWLNRGQQIQENYLGEIVVE
jgi:hypothetical protein